MGVEVQVVTHSPDPALDYMINERGISEATLLEFGVHYDQGRHAVAFPYMDALGRVRSKRYRPFEPGQGPPYTQERGVSLTPYNVTDLDADVIHLCEGEIDTLTLKDLGLAAVGIPGAMNFQDPWRWLFVDRMVRVLFDGDKAGHDGAAKILRLCSQVARDVELVRLPDGEDVNSLSRSGQLGAYL